MELIYYFLPAILLLGLITCYEDIKFGKIKNKWILMAIIYSFLIYTAFLIFNKNQYFLQLIVHFILSILIGLIFWYINVWSAGDGKLFIAYSFLIPVFSYKNFWSLSIGLLINTFFIGALLMIILLIIKIKQVKLKKVLWSIYDNNIKPLQLILLGLYLFTISWLIDFVSVMLNISLNLLLKIIVFIIIVNIIKKITKRYVIYILSLLAFARLIIDRNILSIFFVYQFSILFLLVFIILLLQQFFFLLSNELFIRKMKIADLKQGMVIYTLITKKIFPKYEKINVTKDYISKLKRKGTKEIVTAKTIPFAPILFAAMLLLIFT